MSKRQQTIYEVCYIHNESGNWERSRLFQTIKAARRWAHWLSTLAYVGEIAIYKGGAGGERV